MNNENNCKMKSCFKKIFYKICRKKEDKIAHIALNGVIGKDSKLNGGINIENVLPLLEKAFSLKNVKAVAITINSPGGSPVQSELIYNAIRDFSKNSKVPVYTFARDVAASGGYWLLLSGDEIYAHNSSIIGSIGVIFSAFGFVDVIKKIGIERRVYTEGKNKAILDPFLPEKEDNIEILKEVQKDIFENFKEFVKERRQNKLVGDENFLNDKIFTGAFWSGKKAVELGLVDDIADMRIKMREKFGDKCKIENIAIKKSFIKSFFSERALIQSDEVAAGFLNKIEEKIKFSNFGL